MVIIYGSSCHLLMHLTADDERERSLKIKNLALPDDEMVYPGERF